MHKKDHRFMAQPFKGFQKKNKDTGIMHSERNSEITES